MSRRAWRWMIPVVVGVALAGLIGKLDLESAVVTAAVEEEVRLEAASAAGAALAALHGERVPLRNPLDCDARMSHRGAGEQQWTTTPCYVRGRAF